ncbi:MAG: efflux RND transporter permease subunit, partial [Gammaproteobacteria bacterium]|nr:efflux RND transporter permease subunit [Gammaproteobacteria bacterium]
MTKGGGLAAWSVHHPIGVVMIALAVIILGGFSIYRLGINLLPHIIYPEVRVRILDPGVPVKIMEDEVTRQLEEQLAITEDAVSVQSRTTEGRTNVDLSFEYGKDIDIALRDASTRLDRAKRYMPDTIQPPVIYKRDPSQIPIAEFVIGSPLKDPVELRAWVDYTFARWFLNLPGVAAAEVAGGLIREIRILPDQQRLAGLNLTVNDLVDALKRGNVEKPGGRLRMSRRELSGRTMGRFANVGEISQLPLEIQLEDGDSSVIRLHEVARIIDGHEEERLRIRSNGIPGIKLSIQKQPQANTVAVVDTVRRRLSWLREQGLIP